MMRINSLNSMNAWTVSIQGNLPSHSAYNLQFPNIFVKKTKRELVKLSKLCSNFYELPKILQVSRLTVLL